MILFADCDDKSQLYDFTTHKCVSQCPCGYAPFRKHHTAYCEPGMCSYNTCVTLNIVSIISYSFQHAVIKCIIIYVKIVDVFKVNYE